MSEKPVVVLDKAWYRKNKVKQGYVSTPKILEAKSKRKSRWMAKKRGRLYGQALLSQTILRHEIKKESSEILQLERVRDSILSPRQEAYSRFLASNHWKSFRSNVIEQRGCKCEDCGSAEMLQVHHVRYPSNWMDTRPADVKVVCRACHEARHKISYQNGERRLGPGAAMAGRTQQAPKNTGHLDPAYQKHPHRGRDGQPARPRDAEGVQSADQPSPLQGHPA